MYNSLTYCTTYSYTNTGQSGNIFINQTYCANGTVTNDCSNCSKSYDCRCSTCRVN
jgi:hypothetical protein